MALEPKIHIEVPNTPLMRSVLKELVDHLYYQAAPHAPSYDAVDAYEALAAAITIALQPERLEKDPPDA